VTKLLLVGVGGLLGSVARYGVSLLGSRLGGASFPWGTLAVNLVGCLMVGGLIPFLAPEGPMGERGRLFLVAGVLGGFTTFSAFGLETQALAQRGQPGLAALYVVLSVGLGLGAVWAGKALGGALR
jgi:CrcB protein